MLKVVPRLRIKKSRIFLDKNNNTLNSDKGNALGDTEEDKGVDGDVIRQITLSSLSNPQWANGNSYDENMQLCIDMCLDSDECSGIQVTNS